MRSSLAFLCVLLSVALGACESSPVSREVGASCSDPSQCESMCLVPSAETPGGMCTRRCASDTDCPENARCLTRHEGVCLYSCRDDGDCLFLGGTDAGHWTCQQDVTVTAAPVLVCLGSAL